MRTRTLSSIALAVFVASCGSRSTPAVVPTAAPKTPHLSSTKFVAFGDSITEGFVQVCEGELVSMAGIHFEWRIPLMLRPAPFSPTAYPLKLQARLNARYVDQEFSVKNEGSGGETIEQGQSELPTVLRNDSPDVLLLQEGTDDINQHHKEAIPLVVDGLRAMIQLAKKQGVTVFVGTLLPQRPGGCRAYDYIDEVDDIVPANSQIRRMVGMEGAVLVDLYQAFVGHTATLLGHDGLHPSEAGYQVIADTFFDAIQKHLEN